LDSKDFCFFLGTVKTEAVSTQLRTRGLLSVGARKEQPPKKKENPSAWRRGFMGVRGKRFQQFSLAITLPLPVGSISRDNPSFSWQLFHGIIGLISEKGFHLGLPAHRTAFSTEEL